MSLIKQVFALFLVFIFGLMLSSETFALSFAEDQCSDSPSVSRLVDGHSQINSVVDAINANGPHEANSSCTDPCHSGRCHIGHCSFEHLENAINFMVADLAGLKFAVEKLPFMILSIEGPRRPPRLA